MNHQHKQILKTAINKFIVAGSVLACLWLSSCKKWVEVPPPKNQLVSATVFSNDQTATAAMLGIYSSMMGDFTGLSGGNQSISYLTGLSSDEFSDYSFVSGKIQFFTNSLTADNIYTQSIWKELYKYIFDANAIIEGVGNSAGITLQTKAQLEGEARFVRAFCYFYLANLYGDVPLAVSTDYRKNAHLPMSDVRTVYDSVVADLKAASELLADDYSFSKGERTRPNKWCAKALLARTYLFTGDWTNAEKEATSLIDNPNYVLETDLKRVFLKNSLEAIWQLQPVFPGLNTFDAYFFIIHSAPRYVALTNGLLHSFETQDQRPSYWIDSFVNSGQTYYFPYKYTVGYGATSVSEYLMAFRLAEQYLIRAEARAQEGDITGSQADLNSIRKRAGLPETKADDKNGLLAAALQERKCELFSEWGHRWLDVKRVNKATEILAPVKSPNWQPSDALYPIPLSEIQKDALLKQNPGY